MGCFMGFPFGEAKRNQPVDLKPCNPLPQNKMSSNSGNAGLDGYSVLSRADRFSDLRPAIGDQDPQYWGPRQTEEQ